MILPKNKFMTKGELKKNGYKSLTKPYDVKRKKHKEGEDEGKWLEKAMKQLDDNGTHYRLCGEDINKVSIWRIEDEMASEESEKQIGEVI